jgi:hypothetical protein
MHVKIQFARVYNFIIQDFYNDCLISDCERQLMQYYIPKDTTFDTWFSHGVRRITKSHITNKQARYQLTRFLSYLWNPKVPKNITVENMKTIRITIPVYNETMIELGERCLVTLGNLYGKVLGRPDCNQNPY